MLRASVLLAAAVLAAPTVHAQPGPADPPPRLRVALSNLLAARVNPLGLEDQLRVGVLWRLVPRSSPLLRDNFVYLGLAPRLSPAYLKLGPSVELQPLSILNLRFTAELVQWFGTFDTLQSFPSPLDEFSDTTRRQLDDSGRSYRPSGAHLFFEPMVQLRFGPIAFRNRFSLEWFYLKLRDGDRAFYDISLDAMIQNHGLVIGNEMDLLWLQRFRRWPTTQLALGARYSVVHPLYRSDAYRPGETQHNPNSQQRVGPIVAFTFFDRGYTRFNKPTLILIASWYAKHRYRTGADVSAAVPYLVLGFAFTSDLVVR